MVTIEQAFKEDKDKEKRLNMKIALVLSIITPLLAIGFVCVKERRDYLCPNNTFSLSDLVYSFIGVILGSGIHLLLIAMIL